MPTSGTLWTLGFAPWPGAFWQELSAGETGATGVRNAEDMIRVNHPRTVVGRAACRSAVAVVGLFLPAMFAAGAGHGEQTPIPQKCPAGCKAYPVPSAHGLREP